MAFLTDRSLATGVTLDDLIHIVITGDTSQGNPAGSSYKAKISQVLDNITDVYVTGGTYSNGTATFKNNTGGTFNVTGFYTGATDVYVTGGTYSNGTTTFRNNTGGTFNVTGYYTGSSTTYSSGSYYSLLDQPISVAGTVYTMSAETQSFSSGITLSNGGRFTFTNTGIYNIQFSVQLEKNSGTKSRVFIWLYKNGSNLPNSNTEITLDGANGDRAVAAWNFLESFNSGEYFEIKWTASQNNTFLQYDPSPLYGPVIPSVIITITESPKN